jgi:hypothetical protein
MYGMRGTYYSAFLGGASKQHGSSRTFEPVPRSPYLNRPHNFDVMVTSVAMFLRNLVILALFAPVSAGVALLPLGTMSIGALAIVLASESIPGR